MVAFALNSFAVVIQVQELNFGSHVNVEYLVGHEIVFDLLDNGCAQHYYAFGESQGPAAVKPNESDGLYYCELLEDGGGKEQVLQVGFVKV